MYLTFKFNPNVFLFPPAYLFSFDVTYPRSLSQIDILVHWFMTLSLPDIYFSYSNKQIRLKTLYFLSSSNKFMFSFVSFFPSATDERDKIQKKTFTKWVNKHLKKVSRFFAYFFHLRETILICLSSLMWPSGAWGYQCFMFSLSTLPVCVWKPNPLFDVCRKEGSDDLSLALQREVCVGRSCFHDRNWAVLQDDKVFNCYQSSSTWSGC